MGRLTEYDICLLRLRLNELGAVEIPVDEFEACIFLCDFGALVGVADEAGDVVFWVGLVDGVESVATNVAGRFER